MRPWHRSIWLCTFLSGCSALYAIQACALQPLNLDKLTARLKASDSTPINILQLGDSHTAADWMSGEMRRLFQSQYGEGGIGFISATPVPGTRYDQVLLSADSGQWNLISSRNQHSAEFPLGGYLSLPMKPDAQVTIGVREPLGRSYRVSALYRSAADSRLLADDGAHHNAMSLPSTSGQWRFSPTFDHLNLPLNLTITDNREVVLGGWNIESQQPSGVTYSALGINGATLKGVDAWQSGWQQTLSALRPDLLVLAYGGNEAFDDQLDIELYQHDLTEKLALLRRALPYAVFLLVGPADSIKQRSGMSCEDRQPKQLAQIIQIQKIGRAHV